VFKNIYLPGVQQEGVTDKDSTQGFVEYGIRFKKKPKKIPFTSQAAIIFDKNEPVYTNKCKAVFIKGLSPGIVAGYTFASGNDPLHSNKGPFRIGYTLSPYAPSRPYFQAEVYAGLFEKSEASTGVIKVQQRDTLVNGQLYFVAGRERKIITQRNLLQVIPLHFRYNVTPWMGIGIGAQATLSISEQKRTVDSIYLAAPQLPGVIITSAGRTEKNKTDWFSDITATPFIDIQFGMVKAGPLAGFRYLRELKGDIRNRFFAYLGFRL
ncbi:MAG TPA: hypothetical protein VJ647_04765, partial [Chitinophagaceae bacterium]|nr:hypothetical protein [Chitinophagaceae bacterium]